jgi:hypothetical protein
VGAKERGSSRPVRSGSSLSTSEEASTYCAHRQEFNAIAVLGRALEGVGFASFGLHMDLPAPEGSDPDEPRPSAQDQHLLMENLRRSDATFRLQLGGHLRTELPGASEFLTGHVVDATANSSCQQGPGAPSS